MSDNLLSIADILALDDVAPVAVPVPQWGGKVNIYPLSEAEHDRVIEESKVEGGKRDDHLFMIGLWAASLHCTREEAERLYSKNQRARRIVRHAIYSINGWTEAAIKADEALFPG